MAVLSQRRTGCRGLTASGMCAWSGRGAATWAGCRRLGWRPACTSPYSAAGGGASAAARGERAVRRASPGTRHASPRAKPLARGDSEQGTRGCPRAPPRPVSLLPLGPPSIMGRPGGDVAQLGERGTRTAEVGGSNPLISTTFPPVFGIGGCDNAGGTSQPDHYTSPPRRVGVRAVGDSPGRVAASYARSSRYRRNGGEAFGTGAPAVARCDGAPMP
jgi:hypothetical protein